MDNKLPSKETDSLQEYLNSLYEVCKAHEEIMKKLAEAIDNLDERLILIEDLLDKAVDKRLKGELEETLMEVKNDPN